MTYSNARLDYFLNKGQDRVAKKVLLSHLKDETTFASVASTQRYFFRADILKILGIFDTDNDKKLIEYTDQRWDMLDVDRDSEGTPYGFRQWSPTEYERQLSSGSTITVVSSDNADTTQKVRINGVVGGVNDTELLTLNGTTNVTGSKTFTAIHGVRKDGATEGKVTVTDGSNTLAVIAPADLYTQYQPVDMVYIPDAVYNYRVKFVRTPRKMVNAEDVPDVPELYSDLVLIGAEIEAREDLNDFQRANDLRAIFDNEHKDIKANQGSNRRRRRIYGRRRPTIISRRGPRYSGDTIIY